MALSGIKTLPYLSNTLVTGGPWSSLLSRPGYRVYPYQLGCTVKADTSSTTVTTNGLGDFAANDYVMACAVTNYGDSFLYVPDVNRISRVSSVSGSDDQLVLTTALVLETGEYLLNLGADTASVPTAQPNYDGSTLTLYEDNVGNVAFSDEYVLTGSHGQFRCWLSSGTRVVDLLITDASANPVVVHPFVTAGEEVIA